MVWRVLSGRSLRPYLSESNEELFEKRRFVDTRVFSDRLIVDIYVFRDLLDNLSLVVALLYQFLSLNLSHWLLAETFSARFSLFFAF